LLKQNAQQVREQVIGACAVLGPDGQQQSSQSGPTEHFGDAFGQIKDICKTALIPQKSVSILTKALH
jgi:hypothetical protein